MLDPSTGTPLICGALFIDTRDAFFSLKNRTVFRLPVVGRAASLPVIKAFFGAPRNAAAAQNREVNHTQAYGETPSLPGGQLSEIWASWQPGRRSSDCGSGHAGESAIDWDHNSSPHCCRDSHHSGTVVISDFPNRESSQDHFLMPSPAPVQNASPIFCRSPLRRYLSVLERQQRRHRNGPSTKSIPRPAPQSRGG